MYTVQNLTKIFIAVFFASSMTFLCTASAEAKERTRVNIGPHADFAGSGGSFVSLIVVLVNTSDSDIDINEIKVFNPDGTEASPNFTSVGLEPPFILGPHQSPGFALLAVGISRVTFPPIRDFQVHTKWDSKDPKAKLHSFSEI
jgi:hypothetical protein